MSESTSIRRSAAQTELEDKQLLDRGGAAQDAPLTADVSAPVSSWSRAVGNKQIRHAALVVSRAVCTVSRLEARAHKLTTAKSLACRLRLSGLVLS